MSEKFGFLFILMLVSTVFFPLGMDVAVSNLKSELFMSSATNMHQLVYAEGGVTERVRDYANKIEDDYGFEVTFTANGGAITSTNTLPIGTKVEMAYSTNWQGAFNQERLLQTTNTVVITRR